MEAQTFRFRILIAGLINGDNSQVVFADQIGSQHSQFGTVPLLCTVGGVEGKGKVK